eukprot:13293862-Ditylum_brightwellii.AAC.1
MPQLQKAKDLEALSKQCNFCNWWVHRDSISNEFDGIDLDKYPFACNVCINGIQHKFKKAFTGTIVTFSMATNWLVPFHILEYPPKILEAFMKMILKRMFQ